MSKIKTAVNMLLHNRNAFLGQLVETFSPIFGDEKYLKLMFKYRNAILVIHLFFNLKVLKNINENN